MPTDDFVIPIFKRPTPGTNDGLVRADYAVLSKVGFGILLTSEAYQRISIGAPFGFPTLAMGPGTALAGETLASDLAGTWTLTASLLSTDGFSVRHAGETANRLTMGTVFGLPSFSFGDGTTANAYGTLTANTGLLTLVGTSLRGSVTRATTTKTAGWTWAIGDIASNIHYDSTSAGNGTIPPNSTVPFQIGQELVATQANTGAMTIVAGAGVTLVHPTGFINGTTGQWGRVVYRQVATDTWLLISSTDLTGSGLAFQPLDSDLTTIAALAATTDNFIQSKAGAWASRTLAQVRTDLNLESVTTFSNAAYTAVATDRTILQIGTMSASRTVTLPAASTVPAGYRLTVADASGTVTTSNTILVAKAGTDTVNAGTFTVINTAFGSMTLVSDGTSKWLIDTTRLLAASNLSDITNAGTARTNLGLVIGTNVEAWDADLDAIAALAASNDDIIQRKAGAWTNRTLAQYKTDLNVATLPIAESDVTNLVTDLAAKQPLDSDLTTIAGLTATTDNMIQSVGSAWASRTPAQVKTALALTVGTDVQAYDADLTTIAGLTATTDNIIQSVGSAWASRTPAQVKTALGLTVGTNVQAWDADLDTLAGLAATTDNMIQSVGSAWASRTPAQVKTALGLTIGTNVQAWDADLDTVAGLTATTDSFMQAKGSAWSARTIAQVKTDLGLPENRLNADTLWAAKGDLAVATANDTATVLGVGSFGQVPTADSTAASGLIYANPVHLRDRYLGPNIATPSYESTSRTGFLSSATSVPTTGIVALQAIALPKNFTVHNIAFQSGSTAAVSPTHWWFSLCDSTYTTLRSTADQTTTAWAASTEKRVALSSNYTTTTEGLFYVAFMMTAATMINAVGFSMVTAIAAALPLLAVTGDGSKTTAPADGTLLAAAPASKTALLYCYVD